LQIFFGKQVLSRTTWRSAMCPTGSANMRASTPAYSSWFERRPAWGRGISYTYGRRPLNGH